MAAFFCDFDQSPSPPTKARAADSVCIASRSVTSSPTIKKAMMPTTKYSFLAMETSRHAPTHLMAGTLSYLPTGVNRCHV